MYREKQMLDQQHVILTSLKSCYSVPWRLQWSLQPKNESDGQNKQHPDDLAVVKVKNKAVVELKM